MPAPITTDEEVWSEYIDMYCADMDDEHRAYWEEYFASCMQPIPFGWESIAGYWNFCAEYFNSIGIHDLVDSGKAQAADYADEATRKANLYHAQAMLDYFGESGYNILSDDEVALYTQMVEENSN
jgi:multiple sugar transport system substrate-binding protein